MAILSGRNGVVKYDAAGTTPVEIISVNNFKISWKTPKQDVSCFGDPNKVYVPGLPDVQGTLAGFWNSADTTMFEAALADTPGLLELTPNDTEPLFKFSGLAYLDADLDVKVDSAPTVSGTWMAAGPWTMASGTTLMRGPQGRSREPRAQAPDQARAA
jgi:hypothetical protein